MARDHGSTMGEEEAGSGFGSRVGIGSRASMVHVPEAPPAICFCHCSDVSSMSILGALRGGVESSGHRDGEEGGSGVEGTSSSSPGEVVRSPPRPTHGPAPKDPTPPRYRGLS